MSWWNRLIPGSKPGVEANRARGDTTPIVWTTSPAGANPSPSHGGLFPRFFSTAGDQFDTRTSDRVAASRLKLRGVYTPALPITDRRFFAGRTKVLTNLIRAIEDERLHTVVYGERGLGKTSLMHVLAQTAREARYLVVYVTCGAGSNFDEMIRGVAENLSLRFHVDFGPTSPEAERGDNFLSLIGPDPVTVRGASDLFSKVAGTRVLIALDEFDRSESSDFRRAIAELVKSFSDRSVRVQFVIAGVAANLNELVANVPSIQRSIAAIQLPKMSAAEIRDLIKNGEAVTGIGFDDGAVHAIIARSIGFPYLASLLSHRAGLNAIDEGRQTVTEDDVATATSEAVEEAFARISKRSQIQIKQRVQKGSLGALGALAGASQTTGGIFSLDDISALHADPINVAAAKSLIERLPADDVLIETLEDDTGRTFRFREDGVPTYLWLLAAQGRFFEGQDKAKPVRA